MLSGGICVIASSVCGLCSDCEGSVFAQARSSVFDLPTDSDCAISTFALCEETWEYICARLQCVAINDFTGFELRKVDLYCTRFGFLPMIQDPVI